MAGGLQLSDTGLKIIQPFLHGQLIGAVFFGGHSQLGNVVTGFLKAFIDSLSEAVKLLFEFSDSGLQSSETLVDTLEFFLDQLGLTIKGRVGFGTGAAKGSLGFNASAVKGCAHLVASGKGLDLIAGRQWSDDLCYNFTDDFTEFF